MTLRLSAFVFFLLLPAGQAFCERLPFRVSGIFGQAPAGLSALVQDARGKSKVYRKDDALGDGRIVEITPKGLWVLIDGERQFIGLDGSPKGEPAAAPGPNGAIQVRPEKAAKELGELAAKIGKSPRQTSIKSLNPILGLPKGATITAINRQPAASAKESAETLQAEPANRRWPRAEVSDFAGGSEIYVTPQAPP